MIAAIFLPLLEIVYRGTNLNQAAGRHVLNCWRDEPSHFHFGFDRLAEVARLENDLLVLREVQPPAMTDAERRELSALGAELPRYGIIQKHRWKHANASFVRYSKKLL